MTNKQKIIIGIAAGFAVLCLAACGVTLLFFRNVGSAITNSQFKSPQEAQAAAESIATINMPAGYTAGEGMKILGMTMVVYKSSSSVNIMIMELPTSAGLNDADMKRMQQTYQQQGGDAGMQVVDTKDLTIRNRPAKLVISEGNVGSKGQMRQVILYFMGNHGLASLIISGPVSQWDTASYDKMIQSIR